MEEKKKNQHYVPKFLLKTFSTAKTKKTINLFNKKASKIVFDSSIRDQCKRNYFYGKDLTIENAFMQLEGYISSLFAKIYENKNILKNLSLEEDFRIREFICYQKLRTSAAKNEANTLTNNLAQKMLQYHPELSKYSHLFKVTLINPVEENLKIANDLIKFTLDLEIAILETKLDEFVLSDNPAFTINPFLNFRKWHGSGLGIGSIGIIVLVPISPNFCLCLYDPNIYKMTKRYNHPLSKEDVDIINSLSIYYSENNVYFHSKHIGEYLTNLKLKNKIPNYRELENTEVENFFYNGKREKNSTLLIMGKESVPFNTLLRSIPFSNEGLELKISNTMSMNRKFVQEIKSIDPELYH